MVFISSELKKQILFFIGVFVMLLVLWLPTLRYPIDFDMLHYSVLTENLIEKGTYSEFGVPHSKYIIGHSLLATPFVYFLEKNIGFKVVTLFWSFMFLLISFYFFYDKKKKYLSYLIVLLLLFNHSFLFNSMNGASDIVFSSLFLFSLFFFKLAQRNKNYYYLCGVFTGFTALVRYPGATLFLLYGIYLLLDNHKKLFDKEFVISIIIGAGIFGSWFLRNFLVFGNPFYSDYLSTDMPIVSSFISQFFHNLLFFINPVQNILPILFLFMIYGIYKTYRSNKLILLAIPTYMSIYLIWATPRTRHILPLIPILFYFAIIGLEKLIDKYKRFSKVVISFFILGVLMNLSLIPIYTYGFTNKMIDEDIGILPEDLQFTSEKHYSTHLVLDYINNELPIGSKVILDKLRKKAWEGEGIFRKDLILISEGEADICSNDCYYIEEECNKDYLFKTDNKPEYCVKRYK